MVPRKVFVREQRLMICLLASFTLHTALLTLVPSILSRPRSLLKTPLWVDLVDLKEISSTAPGPSPAALQRPPAEKAVGGSRVPYEAPSDPEKIPSSPVSGSRPLPSADQLIPTVRSLLGLQRAYDNPLNVEPSPNPGQDIHGEGEYDTYLGEVKEAVRRHWKVSGEGELERGTTVIRISINPDGSVASLDLLQSSGMIVYDYEALEAIKQSFPLHPPPKSLLNENGKLSIRFSFHYFLAPQGYPEHFMNQAERKQ